MEAMHAVEALEKAFAKYGQPEIVNTDQDSQFLAHRQECLELVRRER